MVGSVHAGARQSTYDRDALLAAARADFLAATRRIASLRGPAMTGEQYDVYALR